MSLRATHLPSYLSLSSSTKERKPTLPNKSMHARSRMRPLEMRVQDRAHARLDRLDRLGQQAVELGSRARGPGPEVAAGGGLGDAGVVGGGREGDVEGFVCEGGAEAVRVHEEERGFGGVPAFFFFSWRFSVGFWDGWIR